MNKLGAKVIATDISQTTGTPVLSGDFAARLGEEQAALRRLIIRVLPLVDDKLTDVNTTVKQSASLTVSEVPGIHRRLRTTAVTCLASVVLEAEDFAHVFSTPGPFNAQTHELLALT